MPEALLDSPAAVDIVITLVLAVFASTGLWSFISSRFQRKDKEKDAESESHRVNEEQTQKIATLTAEIEHFKSNLDLQSKMLRGIGHDRIIYLGGVFIKQGYITSDEYENLHDYLYMPYRELGGNGTAEKVMDEVKKLPTKPPKYPTTNNEGGQQ